MKLGEEIAGSKDEEEDEVKVVSDDCQSGANGAEAGDAGVTPKRLVLVEEAMKIVQLPSQREGALVVKVHVEVEATW